MTSPVVYFWMGLPIRWKCLSQSVHPWQMNMWKCLLLLVLSPVHLNILSFSLPLSPPPPRWNIWFSPSRHTQQLILLKLKLLKVTPTLLFSLSLSTVHTPPPSFQTRDDFLGQVDVPLSHLPVSYLCLRDRSDCFDTLSYFLSLSEQVFFFPLLPQPDQPLWKVRQRCFDLSVRNCKPHQSNVVIIQQTPWLDKERRYKRK